MSYYYNLNHYSSQEDDNFAISEDSISYLDNDQLSSKNGNMVAIDKESSEYKKRREKNNEAVRRSREKAKIKYNEKEEQIHKLRAENKKLESTAASLRSELRIFKDLAKDLNIPILPVFDEQNNRSIKIENDFLEY